jgi:hypothetical protein
MKKVVLAVIIAAAMTSTATANVESSPRPKRHGYNYKAAKRHSGFVKFWQSLNGDNGCKAYKPR